jgi:hypothetical protein
MEPDYGMGNGSGEQEGRSLEESTAILTANTDQYSSQVNEPQARFLDEREEETQPDIQIGSESLSEM